MNPTVSKTARCCFCGRTCADLRPGGPRAKLYTFDAGEPDEHICITCIDKALMGWRGEEGQQ